MFNPEQELINLYYTQKVRGFQPEQEKYFSKSTEIHIKRNKHHCPYCSSTGGIKRQKKAKFRN
jgi:hypothetical protein